MLKYTRSKFISVGILFMLLIQEITILHEVRRARYLNKARAVYLSNKI